MYQSSDDDYRVEKIRAEMNQQVRTHYQSRMVAVTIPFFQSVISGLLAGILVAILLYAVGVKAKWILIGFALTWIFVTGIVWWVRLHDWNSLIWNMEQSMGYDITGDGQIGAPKMVKAEVSRDNGNHKTYHEFPSDGQKLIEFFGAILAGADLSESRWTPQKKGFSKHDYWSNVAELINAGVLRWKNSDAHSQGVEVTPEGPEILGQWLEELRDTSLPYRPN